MAEIYVPGPFDFVGTANSLSQMQTAQQARQNSLMQMQNTMEDRAREAENRKIAAGNARAEQARKQQFIRTIQSGYTPAKTAVMGPGTIQGNTPASFDPEKVKNELLRLGDLSGLVTFSNAQEQIAKQQKAEAEVTGQGFINEETQQKTKLTTAQTDKEQAETLSKYITLHKEQLNSARNYDEAIALTIATYTPGHPMAAWLAKNGVSQEDAVAELIRRRDEGIPFEETRALMARGATNAAQDAATLAQSEAAVRSSDAAATSSLAAAAKTKYEMDNPGFTIENVQTAAGPIRVRVDKKTGALTPLTLDGKTVAPEVPPIAPTQLEQLQNLEAKIRAADPNDRRLIDIRNAIEKETTKTPGVTVNTGDTAGQTYEKKGSEAIIANYGTLSGVPQQIENYRRVKALIPESVKFMGKGGAAYADVVSFLNNRLGTNINVNDANGKLASAREIESRLFQGILENLKKMDSQPTQAQQQALKDAIGKLEAEPDALARLVDAFVEPLIAKVKVHNDDVDKALKRGDVRAEDYRIKLPETTDSAPKKFKWNASTGLMEQQ
jgi:hypothetical protein